MLERIKKSTLLLVYDKKQYLQKEIQKRGYRIDNAFKEINRISWVVRGITREICKSKSFSCWFGDWYKNGDLESVDTVILYAYNPTAALADWIHNHYPNIRIIFWHENPIIQFYKFQTDRIEQWSFDEADCRKYPIRFNNQYYFNSINLSSEEKKYDVIFIGADKGRYEKLRNIEKNLNNMGVKAYFHIASEVWYKNLLNKKRLYQPRITYEEILSLIANSQAIFDLQQEGQRGLTLRPLEALFFNRKLITTQKEIRNYDFYRQENIYIWNDNYNDLGSFLNDTMIDVPTKDCYDFDSWIKNFWRERDESKV